MTEKKTSESRRRATAKYYAKNPDKKRYDRSKANAKNFILKKVRDEDLPTVEAWIIERKEKGLQD